MKEKLQIPLFVAVIAGLIIAIANHLPDIFKVFVGTPKP
jgi:hypothetical protein